jgi:4-azaleucine resistance transporter AzlC
MEGASDPGLAVSAQAETRGSAEEEVRFDRAGVVAGVRRTLPVALSIFTYGLVFGVLARQAGLSIAESALMSGLVFAGASQFVALDLWVSPLPVGTIVLTTLVVNLRHLLMGAALSPWFLKLPPAAAYGTIFFVSDESWALTMGEFARGGRNAAFLLGSGITTFVAWVSAAIVGQTLGSVLDDPSRWGLDFAFTAVFLVLLVGLWRGKSDLLPWAVAAVVAVAASLWLPGKWYILLGGLSGSLVGAIAQARGRRAD